jgi:hypothetical protein
MTFAVLTLLAKVSAVPEPVAPPWELYIAVAVSAGFVLWAVTRHAS